MSKLNPISEGGADENLRRMYAELKNAFGLHTLPVFFTYIGPFPEYLSYIREQLVRNLTDLAFDRLMQEEKSSSVRETHRVLLYSEEILEWISRYKSTPTFYSFQKDLNTIISANIKLAFVFVALREAVKGWAVAAKKLPEHISELKNEEKDIDIIESEFVTGEILPVLKEKQGKTTISSSKNQIIVKESVGIEKSILPEYLRMMEKDFNQYKTKEEFWRLRVNMEKQVLQNLGLFPHLIFSPYNLIVKYTQKYENFYELIYLLSERFPTLAMQRLLFSAYLLVLS